MNYIDKLYNDKSTEVKEYVKELINNNKIRIGFKRADGKVLIYCSHSYKLIWSDTFSYQIKRR